MKKFFVTFAVCLSVVCVLPPALALAGPITPFSLFGGTSTTVGQNTNVNSGQVGSNGTVTIQSGGSTLTLLGGGAVTVGQNVSVSSAGGIVFNGNVTIQSGASTGDIDSGGNVVIGQNATVTGNIRAGGTVTVQSGAHVTGNISAGALSGTAVTVGQNADVDGTITRNAGTTASINGSATVGGSVTGSPAPPVPYVATPFPVAFAFPVVSGLSHTLGSSSTLALAAGAYNDIVLGQNSVLQLTSGTYFFDTWNFGSGIDIQFNLTGGDILLYFNGLVTLGQNANMILTGGTAANIYAETNNNFVMQSGGEWFGTIVGSGATSDITFGQNSTLTGALYARNNLLIQSGGDVNYVLSNYLSPQPPVPDPSVVPEPATLTLVGLGLAGMVARARRRLKR